MSALSDTLQGSQPRQSQSADDTALVDLGGRGMGDGAVHQPVAHGLDQVGARTGRQLFGVGQAFGEGIEGTASHDCQPYADRSGERTAPDLIQAADVVVGLKQLVLESPVGAGPHSTAHRVILMPVPEPPDPPEEFGESPPAGPVSDRSPPDVPGSVSSPPIPESEPIRPGPLRSEPSVASPVSLCEPSGTVLSSSSGSSASVDRRVGAVGLLGAGLDDEGVGDTAVAS